MPVSTFGSEDIMSTIPPTAAASAQSASQTAADATPANKAVISSDFQTFLKMLTVQMQNQDPLNPTDPSDYAVQLATFSQVEQQVLTNELLVAMQDQFSMMNLSQLAGWVGQEARVGGAVRYDGTPVTLAPRPSPGADRAVLVVRDAAGNTLAREEIPVGHTSYQWFGADAAGDRLPDGDYDLGLESWQGERLLAEGGVDHYARIIEVRNDAGGAIVSLAGGADVPASSITALRTPGG